MAIPENTHALIVEDDNSSVAVLANLFRQMRITYTSVFDPAKAVETALSLPTLSVIFLDLELPGSNGYDVLNDLQNQPELADIPIVAYTSHQSEMGHAREKGFYSFFGKPIRSATFQHDLESVLSGTPVWINR